jgi:hypothetical protein
MRDGARGIFVSATPFADTAVTVVRENLSKLTVILCELDELVLLLEQQRDLGEFLKGRLSAQSLTRTRTCGTSVDRHE